MSHAATVACWSVANGCLVVGGKSLSELAQQVGRTPFYAYDRARIDARIDELRHALPAELRLHYAVKANPLPALVLHLADRVDGFDVASAGELKLALGTGIAPSVISFAGPGKTEAEIALAIESGVVLHIESEREMRLAAQIAAAKDARPAVALRINPDLRLQGAGQRMGGGAQPFGIDAERAPAVLADLAKLPLDFVGFHLFAGSQLLRADTLAEAQGQLIDLAVELARHAPGPVRHLNIGGGFGIPYFPNEAALDLSAVSATLGRLLRERLRPALTDAQVILELGRYMVGEAGLYVTRVLDRKESRGQVFLITDGGLHHHLAASGNFGQVIRRNFPIAIGNRMAEPVAETASVVGCLCTPLDVLADKVRLPRAEPGDLVVVFQSGAYGASASPVNFLSHPPAEEILV
jgi:diaminopimelate decarboxylase